MAMLSLPQLIDTLRIQLQGALPTCEVAHFAGQPATYAPATTADVVLLGYRGSDFLPSADLQGCGQQQIAHLTTHVLCKPLQGADTALWLLESVRSALRTLTLPDGMSLRLIRESRQSTEDPALWLYVLELDITLLYLPADTHPPAVLLMDVQGVVE